MKLIHRKACFRLSHVGRWWFFVLSAASASNSFITLGSANTFIGLDAGYSNTDGSSNVFIGHRAGYSETGSNKLYIENTGSIHLLIYGEFDNNLVKIHGIFEMAEAVEISNIRMKKNIQSFNAALYKISMLGGVSFNWKTEAYADRGFTEDKQIVLIAQNVEKLLSELEKRSRRL